MTPRERVSDERRVDAMKRCAWCGGRLSGVIVVAGDSADHEACRLLRVTAELADARAQRDNVQATHGRLHDMLTAAGVPEHVLADDDPGLLLRVPALISERDALRARLARIEAWAARARKVLAMGMMPGGEERCAVCRSLVAWHTPNCPGCAVIAAYPTPGRDAPATSEGVNDATPGRSAEVAGPAGLAEGLARAGTEDAGSAPRASAGVNAGSEADAAADRLRAQADEENFYARLNDVQLRADIRAVLKERGQLKTGVVALKALLATTAHGSTDAVAALVASRDAARDEAARYRTALHEIAERAPSVVAATIVHLARAALAPASAAPQARPE